MNDELIHFQHKQRTTGIPDNVLDKLDWHIREGEAKTGRKPQSLHVGDDIFEQGCDALQKLTMPERIKRGSISPTADVIFMYRGIPIEARGLPDGLVLPFWGRHGGEGRRPSVNGCIVGPDGQVYQRDS